MYKVKYNMNLQNLEASQRKMYNIKIEIEYYLIAM